MISFALATALLIAAAPADAMGPSRQAYSTCLKTTAASSLEKKAAIADFDTALSTSCAQQESAFKAAIIKHQISMKASRKEAEQAAADWAADLRSNATENYRTASGDAKPPS